MRPSKTMFTAKFGEQIILRLRPQQWVLDVVCMEQPAANFIKKEALGLYTL
jgi:hypothetical protein